MRQLAIGSRAARGVRESLKQEVGPARELRSPEAPRLDHEQTQRQEQMQGCWK